MASSDGFGDILQRAEELCATFETNVELPRVERSLQQILDVGQKLWTKTQHAASQDAVNVKAATLLGPKGFGIPHISQKLEGLSSVKTYEPLEAARDTDIRAFLKNERDNALLAAIQSTKQNTFEQAEVRHWDSMKDEWEREKQRLLSALMGSQQGTIDFSHDSHMNVSALDVTTTTSRSAMDATELAYARQIYRYNDQVVQGGNVEPLIMGMIDVASKFDDEPTKELWNMVDAMCQMPIVPSGSLSSARTAPGTRAALVSNGKQYLEKSYVKHIQQMVTGNLQQAMLGGVPGTINLVKSYLNIILAPNPGFEDGYVEEQPVWPMIYYCLRCGDSQEALIVAQKASPSIGDFVGYLQDFIQLGRLSSSAAAKMKLQYRRQVKNSSDPFKKIVYCLIGCCDLNDAHNDVAEKIDDFLWLRLTEIQASSENSDESDSLTLQQLQCQLLQEFGEVHFQAQQRPHLYFQVLLLTGQFEAAIDFLARNDRLQSHAVHIALVLYEIKLLILPNNIQTHLLTIDSSDSPPIRRLNLARLIMMYTRKFEATDPREALQYYYFLRNLKTQTGENLFMSCVSELVLETREFEMLLGKIEPNGRRKPGAIDKFHSETKKIVETVATDTERKGMFEEAVKLYDLAQSHEKVLCLLNRLISQHVAEAPAPSSARDRIKSLAVSIAQRYRSQSHEGTRQTTGTFYLLLDLMSFFEHYHDKQYDLALDVMQQLKLVPLYAETVEQKVNAFKFHADEIRKTIPDVLIATMNILLMKHKNMRLAANDSSMNRSTLSVSIDDGGNRSIIADLRNQARAIITFAGMIPYRLPGDTNARLVQMEVLMN